MKTYSFHIDQHFPVCGIDWGNQDKKSPPSHSPSELRAERRARGSAQHRAHWEQHNHSSSAAPLTAQLQIAWSRFHAGSCHTSSSCCVQEELSQ